MSVASLAQGVPSNKDDFVSKASFCINRVIDFRVVFCFRRFMDQHDYLRLPFYCFPGSHCICTLSFWNGDKVISTSLVPLAFFPFSEPLGYSF